MQMVLQVDEEKMTTRGFHDQIDLDQIEKKNRRVFEESPPPARDWTPAVKSPLKTNERSNHAPTPHAG